MLKKIRKDELTPELAFEWLDNHIKLIEALKESNNSFSVDECTWCDISTDILGDNIYLPVTAFVQLAKVFSLDLDTCLSKRGSSIDYPYKLSLIYNQYTVYAIATEYEIGILRREWN